MNWLRAKYIPKLQSSAVNGLIMDSSTRAFLTATVLHLDVELVHKFMDLSRKTISKQPHVHRWISSSKAPADIEFDKSKNRKRSIDVENNLANLYHAKIKFGGKLDKEYIPRLNTRKLQTYFSQQADVIAVYLFGSAAHNQVTHLSDIAECVNDFGQLIS